MTTVTDVLKLFSSVTKMDFYPNPAIVSRSRLLRGIVESFDRVFELQAQAMGCNFRAVLDAAEQSSGPSRLEDAAYEEFTKLGNVLAMIHEVIVAERNANWPDTGNRSVVFASGTETGGGSGAEKLVEGTRAKPQTLHTHIIAFVSNHGRGGVYERAKSLGVPFIYYSPKVHGKELYRRLYDLLGADFCLLSGWLLKTKSLPVKRTTNIHPGLLPRFGGKGMHGHHVHEAVIEAYRQGEVTHTGVAMHFVDDEYDHGPKFFELLITIEPDDDPETLQKRVNVREHEYQTPTTDLVVTGQIRLTDDGHVQVPESYQAEAYCPEELRTTAVAAV